ncbi:hypothetical protein RRG08_026631 [Elysia crispata]|uniref:Uncharacterized protein n=1 Tax=Elysia crispata TaxID=231223 RepID=A0AAE1AYF8_9GAST|nr:hypothetical protein RRG08_026631 [Elysia crispata]
MGSEALTTGMFSTHSLTLPHLSLAVRMSLGNRQLPGAADIPAIRRELCSAVQRAKPALRDCFHKDWYLNPQLSRIDRQAQLQVPASVPGQKARGETLESLASNCLRCDYQPHGCSQFDKLLGFILLYVFVSVWRGVGPGAGT